MHVLCEKLQSVHFCRMPACWHMVAYAPPIPSCVVVPCQTHPRLVDTTRSPSVLSLLFCQAGFGPRAKREASHEPLPFWACAVQLLESANPGQKDCPCEKIQNQHSGNLSAWLAHGCRCAANSIKCGCPSVESAQCRCVDSISVLSLSFFDVHLSRAWCSKAAQSVRLPQSWACAAEASMQRQPWAERHRAGSHCVRRSASGLACGCISTASSVICGCPSAESSHRRFLDSPVRFCSGQSLRSSRLAPRARGPAGLRNPRFLQPK